MVKEVDEAYPFFELKDIRADWRHTKARLSARVKSCASGTEFIGIVLEAIQCLRDAHTRLSNVKVPMPDFPKYYYPGLSFMPATQNRVIIMSSATAYADQLKPGTIVTRIDGREARTVMEETARLNWKTAAPPISGSSPQRFRLFAYRLPFLSLSNDVHVLSYLADGDEREIKVTCDVEARGWPHTYNLPAQLKAANRRAAFCRLPSGAGYIYLRSVNNETEPALRQALEAHPDAQGWIVDLRGNGGGGYDQQLLDRLRAFPQPVAVLIDAGCISAGETLARDFDGMPKRHFSAPPRLALPVRSASGHSHQGLPR